MSRHRKLANYHGYRVKITIPWIQCTVQILHVDRTVLKSDDVEQRRGFRLEFTSQAFRKIFGFVVLPLNMISRATGISYR